MSGITDSVRAVPKAFEEQVAVIEPVGNKIAAPQPYAAGHRNLYPIYVRYRFLIFFWAVSLITIGTCVCLGGYWVLGGVISIVATMAFESIGLAWSAKVLADKLDQLNKALAKVETAQPQDRQQASDKADQIQEDVANYISLHANSYVWQKAFAMLLKNTHYHFVQAALQNIFNSKQFQKYYLATFGKYAVLAEGLVEGGHIFNLLRCAADTGNEQMLDNIFALTHVKEDLAGRDLEQFRYQLTYLDLDDPQEMQAEAGKFTEWQKFKRVVKFWLKVNEKPPENESNIEKLRRAINYKNVKLFKDTLEKMDEEIPCARVPLEAFQKIKTIVYTGKATRASEIIQKGIEQAFLKQGTNGPLHIAFTRRNPEILAYLYRQQVVDDAFQKGAWGMRNEQGKTPLHIAVAQGIRQVGLSGAKYQRFITEALLVQDNNGNTCLHVANDEEDYSWLRNVLGVKNILQCFQTRNKNGYTPLHIICQNRQQHALEMICRYLFYNRENIVFLGLRDDSGSTPLHIICENNDLDMLRIICQHNYLRREVREVIKMQDNMELTPLDLAREDAKCLLEKFVAETFVEKAQRLGWREAVEEDRLEWRRKHGFSGDF